jgi:ABC-type dipeptide/oligopeptide/nickel transport system permease component
MFRYLLLRVGASVPVLLGVSLVVFLMVKLVPGDPVDIMFYGQAQPNEEVKANMRHALGLDRPLPEQYGLFIWNAVHGDLGRSYRSKRQVTEEINLRIGNTLVLTLASLAVSVAVGALAGIVAAVRRGSWFDGVSMVLSIGALAVPSFWLGLMLILFFALRLGWFPTGGVGDLRHLVLPALTLGALNAAIIARLMRASMLEALGEPYIVTARAKGLSQTAVVQHALRNALIPSVTVIGLQIGGLLSGAFVVENVFAYPGLGQLTVTAINNRDLPLVQGAILVSAVCYVLANLSVDVVYGAIDPRIRHA